MKPSMSSSQNKKNELKSRDTQHSPPSSTSTSDEPSTFWSRWSMSSSWGQKKIVEAPSVHLDESQVDEISKPEIKAEKSVDGPAYNNTSAVTTATTKFKIRKSHAIIATGAVLLGITIGILFSEILSLKDQMYFHTGIVETVLFESCQTSSAAGLFAACAIVFVTAILYEGLKFLREVLLQKSLAAQAPVSYIDNKSNSNGVNQDHIVLDTRPMSPISRMFSLSHLAQTALHVTQVFISYCLMLIFMTYNVWLCLAVILGAGFGYFLFGWKRAVVVDSNEHCH